MTERLKAPTMSAWSAPNPHLILGLGLWGIREATKNSHSKEIGDWHNFQHKAGVRQSSKKSEPCLLKKRKSLYVANLSTKTIWNGILIPLWTTVRWRFERAIVIIWWYFYTPYSQVIKTYCNISPLQISNK